MINGVSFYALKCLTSEQWRGLSKRPKAPAELVYGGDRMFMQKDVAVYPWHVI